MRLIKLEKTNLLDNKDISEGWIQDRIAEDPSILGLGDLILRDKERRQPSSGRLDLLLQDPETNRRYEVEIQLGKTNESHIIRTLEYWDIEKKRYPQYDHTAVIIAEEITGRFLNVVSLFNSSIPLIAIKLEAYKHSSSEVSLVFTTVLDEITLGLVDEDEEVKEVTDRNYWVQRGTPETVKMADELLAMINEFAENIELKYNKFYIGLARDGQPFNFATFKPRKSGINFEIKLPFSDEIQRKIERLGLDDLGYLKRWGNYRLRLQKNDLKDNRDFIKELLEKSYKSFR